MSIPLLLRTRFSPPGPPAKCRLGRLGFAIVLCAASLVGDLVPAPAVAEPGPLRSVSRLAGRRGGAVAECGVAADAGGRQLYLAGHTDDFATDPSIHLFRSEDAGETWTLTRLDRNYDGLGGFRADPSVVVPAPGEVVVSYIVVSTGIPFAIVVARSTDGGLSFAPPLFVLRQPGQPVGDKPYLSLGRGAGGEPLLLLTYHRLGRENVSPGVWLAVSRDRGLTFEPPRVVEVTTELSSYAVGATDHAGRVYVAYMSIVDGVGEVRLAESRDGGRHFDEPLSLARTGIGFRMSTPAAPSRGVGAVPSLVVDNSPLHPGRLIVTYVRRVPTSTHRTEVLCRYADPAPRLAERVWSAPIPVGRQDQGSQFHSWLAQDPATGTLAVVLHSTRPDPAGTAVGTWLAASADGGATWAEERISERPADVSLQGGASPPNYLEYIGVTVAGGMAHAAWAGAPSTGSAYLLEYQQRSIPLDPLLRGRDRSVPTEYPTVADALAAAEAGDRVVLEGAAGPFRGPVTPAPFVQLMSAASGVATIDAMGAPAAIEMPGVTPGARVTGLRLVGFSEAGIHCGPAPPEEGPLFLEAPFRAWPAAMFAGLRIEGGGRGTGLQAEGAAFALQSARISEVATGVRLAPADPRAAAGTVVSGNLLIGGRSADADGSGDAAFEITAPAAPGSACAIDHNTAHNWDVGLRVRGGAGAAAIDFHHNNLTRIRSTQLQWDGGGPAPNGLVWHENNIWNAFGTPIPPLPAGLGRGDLAVDPGFCSSDSDEGFALRIDSPLSAGNQATGRIGAFDASCAGPSLLRDSRLVDGDRVRLDESLFVPPGRTLLLEAGARVEPSARFPQRGRLGAGPLLQVAGALRAEGRPELPVRIGGGTTGGGIQSEGSDASELRLRHVALFHQTNGIRIYAGTALVEACDLIETGGTGVLVDEAVKPGRVTIRESTVRGAEIGLLLAGPARVIGNRLIGDAAALSGIKVNGSRLTGPLLLQENNVHGYPTGTGLLLRRAPAGVTATGNRMAGCAVGLCLEAGMPELVGTAGGNRIVDNTLGLEVRPGAGDPSPPCATESGARVRRQFFSGNRQAVVVRPGAPLPDLGRSEDPGFNRFLNAGEACFRNQSGHCGIVTARGNLFGQDEIERGLATAADVDAADFEAVDASLGAESGRAPLSITPTPGAGPWQVRLSLPNEPVSVRLRLHDLQGRVIRELLQGEQAGDVALTLPRIDAAGRSLAAGLYWLSLRVEGRAVASERLLVLPW